MHVELKNVGYIYQPGSIFAASALNNINLRINQGEITAVIGHGGSGKSTLSLLLAGLTQPTSGEIGIYDKKEHEPGLFRSVGLVFQYPEQQLFGESVFEEVAFGARNFGTPNDFLRHKVKNALEEVGLNADMFWNRSPFSLSGGQKRRVAIAGVLAINPRIIILDEPTAGLDAAGRVWIMNLAARLHRQGKGVVWITHNMSEAAGLAERVIVLNQGGILLDGTPREVFAEEESLADAGLAIPEAAAVIRALRRRGAAIPGLAVTVEEAHSEINDWLLQGRPMDGEAMSQAPNMLGDMPGAADSLVDTDADEDWESRAVDEIKFLIAEKESASTGPLPVEIAVSPKPAPDFDISGLTGEESPLVPEWRGGGGDV